MAPISREFLPTSSTHISVVESKTYANFYHLHALENAVFNILICRQWVDVIDEVYFSTCCYVVYDDKGNSLMVKVAKEAADRFFSKLEDGQVYSVHGFSIAPNIEYPCVRKDDKVVVKFHSDTIFELNVDSPGRFCRYPFVLTQFEDIAPNGSRFLIVGAISAVGEVNLTPTGREYVECWLIIERGRTIRAKMVGHAYDEFIRRTKGTRPIFVVLLASMDVKVMNGHTYLERTSATTIYTKPDVPQIDKLHDVIKFGYIQDAYSGQLNYVGRNGTLFQLLEMGRKAKASGGEVRLQGYIGFQTISVALSILL